MRIGCQLFASGHSVKDTGKVNSCILGGFRIDGAVAEVENLLFRTVQAGSGLQQTFG